ncbi:MAG TPA: TolC family protein [Thermoanaerobaculia bacterium]|nr:TolC family protein [Thermoanaerobaculia bacterium]
MTESFRFETTKVCRPALACLLGLVTLVAAGGVPPAGAQGAAPSQPASTAPAPTAAAPATPAPEPSAPPSTATSPAAPGVAAAPAPTPGVPAQPHIVDVNSYKPVTEPPLDVTGNVLSLTVDQAVAITLQQNLALILQRYIRNEARLGVLQALGIYDLSLNADLFHQKVKQAVTTKFQASESQTDTLDLSLSQLFPTGGTLTFDYPSFRQVNNNPQGAFKGIPFYGIQGNNLGAGFSLIQPLLNKFGRAVVEEPLLIAINTSQLSRAEFERQVVLVADQVILAYWALVNAREQLVVAQESLQLARDLDDRNRIQVQVGTLAPLELVSSQAAIATREEAIISAQAAIKDGEDVLRLLLNLPPGELWDKEILPTTPAETAHVSIDLAEAVKTAMESRVEVRAELLAVDKAKIVAAAAKRALLPTLTLNAGFGYSGVGTAYTDAFKQVTGLDFLGWFGELKFTYPLQNRQARAADAVASLDIDRFNRQLEQQKKIVTNDVRKTARAVETAAKQIDAAHAARNFQERNLDAEKKRYENGMSTSFQITQIQDQLTQAKSAEVNAVVGYRTALTEYYRALGGLLPETGIKILDPKESVNRFSFRRADLP